MKVYTAGKIWHAPKFQRLRDVYNADVVARWIDMDDDNPIVKHRKDELWRICFEDVQRCDIVLLYAEDFEEEQRGALVEVGMAYGMGKPVYAVNRCKSTSPNGISDVAFTYYNDWQWLNAVDVFEGWIEAETRFRNSEAQQLLKKLA